MERVIVVFYLGLADDVVEVIFDVHSNKILREFKKRWGEVFAEIECVGGVRFEKRILKNKNSGLKLVSALDEWFDAVGYEVKEREERWVKGELVFVKEVYHFCP